MALYHFTVKNDKRPKDRERISAVKKIEYINREGRYKNVDQKRAEDQNNLITVSAKESTADGRKALLYGSPFGKIFNTERGLAVTQSPSSETISIALMIAKEMMGEPLKIYGSASFKRKCIHTAVLCDLPISFEESVMQDALDAMRKEKENERNRFEQRGGIYRKRPTNIHQSDAYGNRQTLSKTLTARTIPTVRQLPKLHVAAHRSADPAMLLSPDEVRKLGDFRAKSNALVRWDLSRERRQRAELTAKKIIKNLEASKGQIYAESHIEYINREKAFAQKGGCVYRQHRLPKWANNSPNVFFRAADQHSPANAARYKEVEFALQNELTLEQNLEIVNRFIDEVMPNHYYDFAVHDKIGAMSDGTHNLHVHIVFSTREIDDVEQKKERRPDAYFHYPLRKNASDQSEELKRNHGAPIERNWSKRAFIPHLRATYQEITNDVLAKYGFRARIDHRSLKDQEAEARMNGDTLLADLLNRMPEVHIGKNGVLQEDSPDAQRLLKYRAYKTKYRDLLFSAELLAHDIDETKRGEKRAMINERLQRIITSNAFIESERSSDSTIGKLRDDFAAAAKKYEHLRLMLVSAKDTKESARLEYMTEEEREDYQAYKKISADLAHWKAFQNELQEPQNATASTQAAYRDMRPVLEEKLESLHRDRAALKEKIDAIETRLSNTDIQKQIQLITHKQLQDNKFIRKELGDAQRTLETAMRALEQGLFAETQAENTLDTYTTKQLHAIARKRYFGLKTELERLEKQMETAKKNVCTMERATQIAANLYTKGDLKKFHAERRTYQKNLTYWENDMRRWEGKEAKQQEERHILLEEKASLDETKAALQAQKIALGKMERALAARIDAPVGKQKIQAIALGIMRKNQPAQKRYDALTEKHALIKERLGRAGKQLEALSNRIKKDGKKSERLYRMADEKFTGDRPSAILSAIAGDEKFTSLVATTRDDDRSLKNWKLMSELAKDEEANKHIYAELV